MPSEVIDAPVGRWSDQSDISVEKLYQIEHPRLVKQYDDIIDVDSDHGYWISKAWLKGTAG